MLYLIYTQDVPQSLEKGKVSTDDLMCFCIYGQMQFSPDTPFFLTVFFCHPLAFTQHVEPARVDNEVRNFTRRWGFKRDMAGLRPLTDAGVVRAVQRHFDQCDNGVDEALEGAKCQAENPFQHQYAGDCHIGIMWWATTQRRFFLAVTGVKCRFIHGESE